MTNCAEPHLVELQLEGCVATITLNRPDRRNALLRSSIELMTRHVAMASAAENIRLLVIDARGPVFCAGMDLGEMQERAQAADGPEQWRRDAEVFRDLLLCLLQSTKPVLAVVQGPVLAGGVGLVLACDLVVASTSAFFALPEPQRGITAAMVTPLLAHRVGMGHASHLLLSGRQLPASETKAWGLCHDVVQPEQLDAVRVQWSKSILMGSSAALAATKATLHLSLQADWQKLLNWTAEQSATARESADAREGLQAFLEKRKPNWQ